MSEIRFREVTLEILKREKGSTIEIPTDRVIKILKSTGMNNVFMSVNTHEYIVSIIDEMRKDPRREIDLSPYQISNSRIKSLDEPLSKEEIIRIYKEILENKRERFPAGFWGSGEVSLEHLKICFSWLVIDYLKTDINQVSKNFNGPWLKKYKLYGAYIKGYAKAKRGIKELLYDVVSDLREVV